MPLADEEFWESRHSAFAAETADKVGAERSGLRRWLDHLRTRVGALPFQSYSEYLVDRLLQDHLPVRDDWKAIEIGCAPGGNLLRLNRLFGYQPYGVENNSTGAKTTRGAFASQGFDPRQVIETDFFSPAFQDEYHECFDVVFSSGFIEHFDEPKPVIAAHVRILKPGGYLFCSIPNLKSFAFPFLICFARDLLRAHNLDIMHPQAYRMLFDDLGLETRFCAGIGMFKLFGVALRSESSLRGLIARAMDRGADAVETLLFACLRGRAIESRWSPYLIYIGRKQALDAASDGPHDPCQT